MKKQTMKKKTKIIFEVNFLKEIHDKDLDMVGAQLIHSPTFFLVSV